MPENLGSLGTAVVDIVADMDAFDRSMKKQEAAVKRAAAGLASTFERSFDLTKLTASLDKAGQKLQSFGASTSRIGRSLTIGVSLPLAAVGTAALKMASDAVESENLFQISMKGMATAARKWSDEISKSLGLNAFEVRKNVGVFNSMFTSMGLGTEKAFELSRGLTELSYDMASFFNLRPEEAFQKLQAGITGETEPLKRLGILVDENTTKTVAYQAGIAKLGSELTQQQKVLARYEAIMRQTSNAHGDLARTIDSPANQLRVMRARTEQLAIEIGQTLLPSLQKFVSFANSVLKTLEGINPRLKEAAVQAGLFAIALGPAVSGLGLMAKGAGAFLTQSSKLIGFFTAAKIGTAATAGEMALLGVHATNAAPAVGRLGQAYEGLSGILGRAASIKAPWWATAAVLTGAAVATYELVDAWLAAERAQKEAGEAQQQSIERMERVLRERGIAVPERQRLTPAERREQLRQVNPFAAARGDIGAIPENLESDEAYYQRLLAAAQRAGIVRTPGAPTPASTPPPKSEPTPFDAEALLATKRLKEEFLSTLRPADELAAHLDKLNQHFSRSQIIAVYGEEILELGAEQRKQGEAVKASTAEWLHYAEAVEAAKFLSRIGPELPAPQVLPFEPRPSPIPLEVKPLEGALPLPPPTRIQQAQRQADELAGTVREYRRENIRTIAILKDLDSQLGAVAESAELYGIALDTDVVKLIKLRKEAQESAAEAKRWEDAWSTAMGNVATDFARGLTDVFFTAQKFSDVMDGIAEKAGRSFTETFLLELTRPLQQGFAKLSREFAKFLNETLTGSAVTGAVSKGGSFLLNLIPGVNIGGGRGGGGPTGIGTQSIIGNTTAGGASIASGAGAGFGATLTSSLASAGISAGIGLGVGLLAQGLQKIGEGRRTANVFVQSVQNPFSDQLQALVREFNRQRQAGTLTLEEARQFQTDTEALIAAYSASASQFAAESATHAKVVGQARETFMRDFGLGFSNILDPIRQTVESMEAEAGAAADAAGAIAGAGIPQTGRAQSASELLWNAVQPLPGLMAQFDADMQLFARATERFASAPAINAAPASAPVINTPIQLTIHAPFNVEGADLSVARIRDEIIPEWMDMVRNNSRGVLEELTRLVKDTLDGIITSGSGGGMAPAGA